MHLQAPGTANDEVAFQRPFVIAETGVIDQCLGPRADSRNDKVSPRRQSRRRRRPKSGHNECAAETADTTDQGG